MKRRKFDFGIDLGTTNSALAVTNDGVCNIKKTDSLKDTLPSCVAFRSKGRILVGDNAWSVLKSEKVRAMENWGDESNGFIEFKRSMGTDQKYTSSNAGRHYDSEELSAEVLKKLRSFVNDEPFDSVVITVPAKFDIPQKDATFRAAELAGFKAIELLPEPVAASMAYGVNSDFRDGFFIVFDFGGGTFDAALVRIEEGVMDIIDTVGDNYLGGKDLDKAIVLEILIPYLRENYSIESILQDSTREEILVNAMKYFAEEAKIQLSFKMEEEIVSGLGIIKGYDDNGEEIELDLVITREMLKSVIGPIYMRAIDLTIKLIERNNLQPSDLKTIILVGGPTYSPILRDMLEEHIIKPDTRIDPMTAVATGAALYASTLDLPEEIIEATRDRTKIQLSIEAPSSSVELQEWVTLKILREKTEGPIPDQVFAEIVRDDRGWSSGRMQINDLGEVFEIFLRDGKSNTFRVELYDGTGTRLDSQPSDFSILSGTIGASALPHPIGIGVKRRSDERIIFKPAKGLEINAKLPATGKITGVVTQSQLRPGNKEDIIEISIYQGGDYSENSRAEYNLKIYTAVINGDKLSGYVPEKSAVEITIHTDLSGRPKQLQVYFPVINFTKEIPIPNSVKSGVSSSHISSLLDQAREMQNKLYGSSDVNQSEVAGVAKDIQAIREDFLKIGADPSEIEGILGRLRPAMIELDRLHDLLEWPKLEEELRERFSELERVQSSKGNAQTAKQVDGIKEELESVIRKRDSIEGRLLAEEIMTLYVSLTLLEQLIYFVREYSSNFDSYHWKNKQRARQLISQANSMIVSNPSVEQLHPVVVGLIHELPEEEKGSIPTELEEDKK